MPYRKNENRVNWFAIKTDKGYYTQFISFVENIDELSTIFMYGSKKEALRRFEIAKQRAKFFYKNFPASKEFPQTCEIIKVRRD